VVDCFGVCTAPEILRVEVLYVLCRSTYYYSLRCSLYLLLFFKVLPSVATFLSTRCRMLFFKVLSSVATFVHALRALVFVEVFLFEECCLRG